MGKAVERMGQHAKKNTENSRIHWKTAARTARHQKTREIAHKNKTKGTPKKVTRQTTINITKEYYPKIKKHVVLLHDDKK